MSSPSNVHPQSDAGKGDVGGTGAGPQAMGRGRGHSEEPRTALRTALLLVAAGPPPACPGPHRVEPRSRRRRGDVESTRARRAISNQQCPGKLAHFRDVDPPRCSYHSSQCGRLPHMPARTRRGRGTQEHRWTTSGSTHSPRPWAPAESRAASPSGRRLGPSAPSAPSASEGSRPPAAWSARPAATTGSAARAASAARVPAAAGTGAPRAAASAGCWRPASATAGRAA